MNNNKNNQVLVPNLSAKKMVDVKPLFDINSDMGFDGAAETIDDAIKQMIVYAEPGFDLYDHSNTFVNLYRIRDMFKTISECNEPISDKDKHDSRWVPKNSK